MYLNLISYHDLNKFISVIWLILYNCFRLKYILHLIFPRKHDVGSGTLLSAVLL